MNTISRNILAVVAGLVVGSVVNMLIIMVSGYIVPPPPSVDLSDAESLKSSMHLFGPINFLMPFLAHAIGTFVGALLAALIAGSHKMLFALMIGGFFLIGGVMMVFMLPSPLWFSVVDLGLAYLPMALLGGKLGKRKF
ncbi:MAG: hypothetical protein FD170_2599 [Bacteroidetes bacterium]|nr:MAG: hypothetical protein FD170_2599 [Bacteroidota bacterium]